MSKVEGQKRDLEETVAKYEAVIDGLKAQKCVRSLELEEELEMEQAGGGTQLPEDVCCPRQQLQREGEELRTQCRDREGLRSGIVLFLRLSGRLGMDASPAHTRMGLGRFLMGLESFSFGRKSGHCCRAAVIQSEMSKLPLHEGFYFKSSVFPLCSTSLCQSQCPSKSVSQNSEGNDFFFTSVFL